jgi:3-hydroxyisobutyrate dehydrogenase-like beta-hydroxyacid dehydrogenase
MAPPDSSDIAVIGLGLMGTAITERLLEAGYRPRVWNRTREKADSFLAAGARWSDRPLAECGRIVISLYSSNVVTEVLTPWLADVRSGQIVVDTTTGDPEHSALWSARFAERSAVYLDAPISGSSEQTRRGEATAIVSGDRTAFDNCADLWPILGRNVFYVGDSGAAARMKLVSNLVLGLNRAALAEGLAFAEALGLDLAATLPVLLGSAAYSRQMDTKGPKMLAGDFTPQARLSQHLKDVRLMLQSADSAGVKLRLTETHRELLEQAESMGLGDLDNSAIFQTLRKPLR